MPDRDFADARRTFDRDGFVIVPDLIPSTLLAELRAHVDAVLDGDLTPDLTDAAEFQTQWEPRVRHDRNLPRREKVRVVFHLSHNHTWFQALSRSPEILNLIEALIGPNIRYYTDQMFVKPPRVGSEVPWHQDAAYWPAAAPQLVSLWLAIDDVTIANGCVRFIPGSHAQTLPHETIETDNPNNITTRAGTFDPAREVPVELTAGSVCVHHARTVHRSLPNTSDRPRRGLVLIYMPADMRLNAPWNFRYGFALLRGHGALQLELQGE